MLHLNVKYCPKDMDRDNCIEQLITTFNELNSNIIDELEEEPSPLEFMRYVARNVPFVVRGACSSWKAVQNWSPEYLKAAMRDQNVNVAVTPYGNADSPTLMPEIGDLVLAKPHEEQQLFSEFIDYVMSQERDADDPKYSEVRYAQTQNDNFRDEYASLLPDAQQDIPFARIALEKKPEAINMWIGNSKSVTATHKDNFENIFVQVRGKKHFTLLPPLCLPCMNERNIPGATYTRLDDDLVLTLDNPHTDVPFVTWDFGSKEHSTRFSDLAQPMHVTLEAGDLLYLPAMWYHKVTLSTANDHPDGLVVSLNYWFDMEFSGTLYPLTSFLRQTCLDTV